MFYDLKTFEDPKVYEILQQVDRKDFVPSEELPKAYINSTAEIGWNTTISTPKVHSQTLETLLKHFKPGGKALDIGCGSGYFTTCMALAMGDKGKVFSVDHIQSICDFAKSNIMKNHKELIESNIIEFVNQDGRKGLADKGPFDVIHVGGAVENVPKEFTE